MQQPSVFEVISNVGILHHSLPIELSLSVPYLLPLSVYDDRVCSEVNISLMIPILLQTRATHSLLPTTS